MLNSFSGLEMGKRALNAFRQGIDTAGHNVSNVDTAGYSRQRVNLVTTDPFAAPSLSSPAITGQIGTGVKIDEIVRIRDEFLDLQYRSELSSLGYWDKVNSMYDMVQLYIAEPQGSGLRAGFDTFWKSLEELQKNPESTALRESMVQSAQSLGTMLDTVVKGYDAYASAVNSEVKSLVDQANSALHEVATLNKQIYQLQASGQNPNDLLDKRDLLLDKLTEMLGVDIQEPYQSGGVTGEFFITLNGRTLVQGDKVRELAAHAFQWEGKTYYDVQVRDNEFDIVEDCSVTLALATGPEGIHMLKVDRLANGKEWTVGGEDALCLNPDGSLKTVLTSQNFAGGIARPAGSAGDTHTFTVASGKYSAEFTLTWNGAKWDLSANVSDDGGTTTSLSSVTQTSASGDLTTQELTNYIENVFDDLFPSGENHISVTSNSNGSLTLTSEVNSVIVEDAANLLGITTGFVHMRTRPTTTTEGLGLSTSFRIQVGSQGTLVSSKTFDNASNPDLSAGDILGLGENGESYTFRLGAHDSQIDVTVSWDTDHWVIESDTGERTTLTAGAHLMVADMTNFLRQTAILSSNSTGFTVGQNSATPPTWFSVASNDNHLISISDVEGDLAVRMGMANPNPVITIDVQETDSLETIRNKINEKYQEAYGLTTPEQWVHATLEQDTDQSWYLTIASDVAGEAQRITLMGDEDGNMQTLRRLGLLKLDPATGNPPDATKTYREVTAYSKIAVDASFTFDGVRYLSADNKFDKARRVPAGTNRTDYSAKTLETVSEGIWLDLKGVGQTSITVRHHIEDGSIKALQEIRDGVLPQLKGELDEIAWALIKNFNAYQYSGYGIGGSLDTTGAAFFNALGFKSGSASLLDISEMVKNDVSVIGAAMGKLDENGKAIYGQSAGNGSGTNAARMASLHTSKLLNNNSASLGDFYEAYLSKIGSEAGRASLMYKSQKNLTEQIDKQRQSVMGVNIDEEMIDILKFNQAFNAMSRYVTTIDEMLDRIINNFGLVGR
ncbi:MAG: flagellar hook-associated protein FlgK [Synergistaceae bacterium]|jgi:flagellar hook-associated protein FlgK|nr:flagellar hook-associated protein FlgK [Synergistaceae bacterium]